MLHLGISFVRFKDHGFWAKDDFLLDWMMAALREINQMERPDAWQIAVGREWDEAITKGFPGGVNPRLDKILTNEHRTRFVTGLAQKIEESTVDPKVKHVSELLIDLIGGKLKSTVSSPIDYW